MMAHAHVERQDRPLAFFVAGIAAAGMRLEGWVWFAAVGFLTEYIITQTDIYAAAVSHAGISSISSYWGEGYWGYGYNAVSAANSFPWNRKDIYIDQSPLFGVENVTTPLLLLHGGADTNVIGGTNATAASAAITC